jgi:hypothetical protein
LQKKTPKIALKMRFRESDITNDWKCPGVQVVACVKLVCKLKLKSTLILSRASSLC